MSSPYLESPAEVVELCAQARSEGRLGLDLEFLREGRYYPQLALIQARVSDRSVLLDPLVHEDLSPLEELLAAADVVKVLHAPMQDLEIFWHRTQQPPARIFDTQLAAAMLGMGTQISLANLVESRLGTRLRKGESFTDWMRRPLTSKQEEYALLDVEHLLELHDGLQEELASRGRSSWIEEELQRYESPSLYRIDLDQLYRKVKRFRSLDARGQGILRELARWREEEARSRNRPRRSVVSDEALLEIARTAPQDAQALGRTRGLQQGEQRRSTRAILETIRQGQQVPESELPKSGRRHSIPAQAQLPTALLGSVLKIRCAEAQIDPSLIARLDELEEVVARHLEGDLQDSDFPILQGWRGELVGHSVRSFLEGRTSIHLEPETARPVFRELS